MIRLLRADEIECRISTISERGLSLLLFKDARVDQKILDESFTPFGWKRTHQEIGGNLYCTVEVWDSERQQWIAKQDVGTESYSEKEKGQASDSFKRACFNWGIGRELYTAPFIWIPASLVEIRPRGDRFFCNERFSVTEIAYDENRVISTLKVVNGKDQVLYSYNKSGLQTKTAGKPSARNALAAAGKNSAAGKAANGTDEKNKNAGGSNGLSLEQFAELERELKRTGVPLQMVLDRYLLSSLDEMTEANFKGAMNALRRTDSKTQKAA